MKAQTATVAEKLTIALMCLTGVTLVGLQSKLGWAVLGLAGIALLACRPSFRRQFWPLAGSLAILGITPITTDISLGHALLMAALLSSAIMLPYLVSRYIYRDGLVKFQWHHGRGWLREEVMWIGLCGVVAYFLFPWYFTSTGVFHNWPNTAGLSDTTALFIGTNTLGIWDELFFVNIVLGAFRRYLPFAWANLAQATIFTSFLYELGFRSIGPLFIFPFALIQGYVFKRVESLLYVIAIHLTVDFILFLVLIHAYHPGWVPILS